jgi:hypothetical protein
MASDTAMAPGIQPAPAPAPDTGPPALTLCLRASAVFDRATMDPRERVAEPSPLSIRLSLSIENLAPEDLRRHLDDVQARALGPLLRARDEAAQDNAGAVQEVARLERLLAEAREKVQEAEAAATETRERAVSGFLAGSATDKLDRAARDASVTLALWRDRVSAIESKLTPARAEAQDSIRRAVGEACERARAQAERESLSARQAVAEALQLLLVQMLEAEVRLIRLAPDHRGSLSVNVVQMIANGETCRPRQIF